MKSSKGRHGANYHIFSKHNEQYYLTVHEMKLLAFAVQGWSCQQMSQHLNISMRTIESHFVKIKKRFKCKRLPQLIYVLMRDEVFQQQVIELIE